MTKRSTSGISKTVIRKILKRAGYTMRRENGKTLVIGRGKRREFTCLREVADFLRKPSIFESESLRDLEDAMRETEAEWEEAAQDESEAEGEVES